MLASAGTTESTAIWFDNGKPMIAGSRVPVAYALAAVLYSERGINDFLEHYPWISRKQAEEALDWLYQSLLGAFPVEREEAALVGVP